MRATNTTPAAAITVSCIALFTDMLVYGLAIPVLPLLPAVVSAGPTATGLLFAGYAGALLVSTPLAGRLVDRVGPRRPLLLGLFGLGAATLLFAVGAPYWLLLLARILQGAAAGMSWVAGLALIAAVTPMATRGRAMGLAMSMVSVGVLAGPPLAGLLVDHFGPAAPFLLGTGVAVLDGVARLLLVRGQERADEPSGGPVAVLRVPGSWSVVGVVVVGAGAISAIEPVLPLHLTERFGMDAVRLGLVFAVAVLSGAVLNPFLGSLVGRCDARVLVAVGVVGSAAALVWLGFAGQQWQVWVAMAVLGGANAFLLAPATPLIGEQGARATPPALGGGYALFNLAFAGGMTAGPTLAGAGTDLAGLPVALAVCAALALLVGGIGLPRLPSGRSDGAPSLPHDRAAGVRR